MLIKALKYFIFSLLLVFTREFFIGKMKTKKNTQNSHYSHRRVKATQIFTMSLCYVLSHLWFQQAFIFWYFHVRFANGAVSQILRNIFIPKLGFSSKTWWSRFSGVTQINHFSKFKVISVDKNVKNENIERQENDI